MQTVYIHISNEDGVLGEISDLPQPTDQYVVVVNPRKRDGKDLHYLQQGVSRMLIPWWRITFIELMGDEQEEEVFTFIRE